MSMIRHVKLGFNRSIVSRRISCGFEAFRDDEGRWTYSFEPTLGSPASFELEVTRARRLDELFRSGRVGLAPDAVMGLDGDTTTVEVGAGFNAVTYTWWGPVPAGWAALGELAELFLADARGKVPLGRRV